MTNKNFLRKITLYNNGLWEPKTKDDIQFINDVDFIFKNLEISKTPYNYDVLDTKLMYNKTLFDFQEDIKYYFYRDKIIMMILFYNKSLNFYELAVSDNIFEFFEKKHYLKNLYFSDLYILFRRIFNVYYNTYTEFILKLRLKKKIDNIS